MAEAAASLHPLCAGATPAPAPPRPSAPSSCPLAEWSTQSRGGACEQTAMLLQCPFRAQGAMWSPLPHRTTRGACHSRSVQHRPQISSAREPTERFRAPFRLPSGSNWRPLPQKLPQLPSPTRSVPKSRQLCQVLRFQRHRQPMRPAKYWPASRKLCTTVDSLSLTRPEASSILDEPSGWHPGQQPARGAWQCSSRPRRPPFQKWTMRTIGPRSAQDHTHSQTRRALSGR